MSAAPTPSAPTVKMRLVHASPPPDAPRYTIGTLVTDLVLYGAMRATFRAHGFTDDVAEFVYIDNSGEAQTDAYRGLNALLASARAPFVILCHQDITLVDDGLAALDARLDELNTRDPNWAVAGNAGGVGPGRLALRITDPHGADQRVGDFPERTHSLDENFLVVRRDSRIGFSHDLRGFHLYGTDICLHAEMMGYTSYVIDFHLHHHSAGKKGASFAVAETAFRRKWSRALSPRWLQTTCALIHLAGSPTRQKIGRLIETPLARLARRLPNARGWKHNNVRP